MENAQNEHSENDLKWYKAIAKYKWEEMDDQDEYQCRKCSNPKFYTTPKRPYDRKCTNHQCKHIESVTAHTPFHRLHIPISKAVNILEYIRLGCNDYNEWFQSLPEFHQTQFAVGNSRDRKFSTRTSSEQLSKRFNLPQRTVYLFVFRFASKLPEVNNYNQSPVPLSWYRGVEKKNHATYSTLYNLMVTARDSDELVELAIKGN